jgi:hypothetical protein
VYHSFSVYVCVCVCVCVSHGMTSLTASLSSQGLSAAEWTVAQVGSSLFPKDTGWSSRQCHVGMGT